MQVKVCPKCGSENKADKASCSGCYASLESVAPTEAKERPAPVQTQPAAQRPPAAQPLSSSGPAGAGAPAPNHRPPSTYGPSFNERRSAPVKNGLNWGAIVFVVLLLGGAAFAGWWFFLKPASPEAVVQKFIDANKVGDYDALKSCLCQTNIAAIGRLPGGEEATRQKMKQGGGGGQQIDADIVNSTYENSGAIAVVEVRPKDQKQLPPGVTTTEVVLVQEDGKWKIDMGATVMRAMKQLHPNGVPGQPRFGK